MKIINDDSKIYLRNYLFNNSIDSMVTDPPAFISFMGKEWDGFDKLNHISDIFKECYRVLKPGAYGVVWALPRTSHHTAKALEDSGFEIRDIIHHVQGQGFPKSHNISKGFDKKAGVEREIISKSPWKNQNIKGNSYNGRGISGIDQGRLQLNITAPATDLAKKYEGFGTALKPAVEHWILVRKPLSEKTVVDNVEKWGTGGLNIDGCRVPVAKEDAKKTNRLNHKGNFDWNHNENTAFKLGQGADISQGRFPANLTHDGSEEVEREFLEQSEKMGMHKAGNKNPITTGGFQNNYVGGKATKTAISNEYDDEISNSASRFFNSLPDDIDTTFIYQPKASTGERNKGLEGITNKHPTIKSVALMSHLIKLTTPPNGICLDPFMGSGSTGVACVKNGFDFIGIEQNKEYFEIAKARIESSKIIS